MHENYLQWEFNSNPKIKTVWCRLFPLQVFLRANVLNISLPSCVQMVQFSILSLPVCIREQQDIIHGKIQKGRGSVQNDGSRNNDKWEAVLLPRKLLVFLQTIFSPPEWIRVIHRTSVGHFSDFTWENVSLIWKLYWQKLVVWWGHRDETHIWFLSPPLPKLFFATVAQSSCLI